MNEPIAPLFRLTDEELDLLSAAAEVDTPIWTGSTPTGAKWP